MPADKFEARFGVTVDEVKPVLLSMFQYMRRPENLGLAPLSQYKLALKYRKLGASDMGIARMMYWPDGDKTRRVLDNFKQILENTWRARQIGYVDNALVPARSDRMPAEHRRQITLELLGDRLLNSLERMPR